MIKEAVTMKLQKKCRDHLLIPVIGFFSKYRGALLLLLITRLLLMDGGMVEDHGASEAGQLPRVWTRGCRETENRQRVTSAKSP